MSRRRSISVAATAVAALTLTACWPVPGQNASRTAHNPLESRLTPATVGGLDELWTSEPVEAGLDDPVVVAGGGVVASTGAGIHRFDGSTGALDWSWYPEDGVPGITGVSDPFTVDDRVLVGYGFGNLGGNWSAAWLDATTGVVASGASPVEGLVHGVRGTKIATSYHAHGSGTPIAVSYQVSDTASGSTSGGMLDLADFGDTGPQLTLGTAHVYSAGPAYLAPAEPGGSWRRAEAVRAFAVEGVPSGCAPPNGPPLACPTWSTEVGGAPTRVVLGPGEEVAYVGTSQGQLVALDTATGAILWTADVGAAVAHPPALADGTLYVPTADGDVVAVDADGCGAATCQPLWSAPLGAAVATQPAVGGTGADAVVYAATTAGTVHALAAAGCGQATCATLWDGSTGSAATGGPIVSGGRVYVATQDGRLHAYGLTTP